MKTKKLVSLLIAFALVFSTCIPIASAAKERSSREHEQMVFDLIQENVRPEHALDMEYRGVSKSEIKELKDIVDSVTVNCSTTRDKAYAIYLWVSRNLEYNYDAYYSGDPTYLHCADKDCPVRFIENASGVSVLRAHHTYKSGTAVCEGYANLCSVLMKMAGIPTLLIINMEGPHAFNAFYDDSRWVFFDATWAGETKAKAYFDMSLDKMYSTGAHRIQSLQSLDKDGMLYNIWFSEKPYCYIAGSLTGHKTIRISPGLYNVRFAEEMLVNPVCSDVETVVVEEGVKEIPENLFKNCDKLSEITFPSTLKKIGSYAFENCTSLKEFVVPDTVTSLGTAILEDSGVEYLKVGASVSDCPGTSFMNLEKLKKVDISEGVE